MIISVHAYVHMGATLNVTVSTVDDGSSGLDRRPSFFGRSSIPIGPADVEREDELVYAVGNELLNLAYGYRNAVPAWVPPTGPSALPEDPGNPDAPGG